MTYERWQDLVTKLQDKFPTAVVGKEEYDEGYVEYLECVTPRGKMRFELVVKPKVIGKKTYYSKRMGSSSTVEYQYSPEEHTLTLRVLVEHPVSGDWQEISLSQLAEAGLM